MKFLFSLTIVLMAGTVYGQVQADPLICNGGQIPLSGYEKYSVFYFPKNDGSLSHGDEMPGYSRRIACVVNNLPGREVTYNLLAGHRFMLIDTCRGPLNEPWGEHHECLVFTLMGLDTGFLVSFTFPRDAIGRSEKEAADGKKQSLSLTGAIHEADQDMVNGRLRDGPLYYYTKFPVKVKYNTDTMPRKFQRVRILGAGYGSPGAPVRISFKPDSGEVQAKNVIICGTNVLPAFFAGNLFQDFFQAADPRAMFAFKGNYWDTICKSLIAIGMNSEEVEASLGKPVKNEQKINEKGTEEIYYYDKQTIYFDGGKVIKYELQIKKP